MINYCQREVDDNEGLIGKICIGPGFFRVL